MSSTEYCSVRMHSVLSFLEFDHACCTYSDSTLSPCCSGLYGRSGLTPVYSLLSKYLGGFM